MLPEQLPPYVHTTLDKIVAERGGTHVGHLINALRQYAVPNAQPTQIHVNVQAPQLTHEEIQSFRDSIDPTPDPDRARLQQRLDEAIANASKLRSTTIIPKTPKKQHKKSTVEVSYPYVTYHQRRATSSPWAVQVPVSSILRAAHPSWPSLIYGGYHTTELAAAKVGYAIKQVLDHEELILKAEAGGADALRARTVEKAFDQAVQKIRDDAAYEHLHDIDAFKAFITQMSAHVNINMCAQRQPNTDGSYAGGSRYDGVYRAPQTSSKPWRVQVGTLPLLARVVPLGAVLHIGVFDDEHAAAIAAEAAYRVLKSQEDILRAYFRARRINVDAVLKPHA